MQPYQEADQTTRHSGENTLNTLKYGAGAAIGASGYNGAKSLINKIIPLLNSVVPESFAKKALSKINPRLGAFIEKVESEGFGFDEIKEFIQGKVDKTEENNTSNVKENRNIIEQYSPELNRFVSEKIKSGEDPVRTAAMALFEKGNPYEKTIRKIEKDHKTNWSALVQSIYGGGNPKPDQMNQQQQPPQPQQGPTQQGLDPMVAQILQQGQLILKARKGQ